MIVFDIETSPRPDDELRAIVPPFDPSKVKLVEGEFDPSTVKNVVAGPFDPSTVKTGTLKDQAKIDAKIEAARAEHEAAVADSEQRIEQARAEFEAAKAGNNVTLAAAEANHWQEQTNKAALSPVTGQVLAIGYFAPDVKKHGIAGQGEGKFVTEADVIVSFWAKYRDCRAKNRPLVGFNIFGFDLPFLVRRSWLLGIDVPDTLLDPSGRYFDKVFVDLMARWKCGAYQDSIKLDLLARFFGVGGKPSGINGGDFARLWQEDREAAKGYLVNDLAMTAACAARMGYV